MLSFVLPSCQVSWFFPVRSYAPHKTATMQLQPAPPPSFFNAPSPLFFCLIFPWKNTRQVWQEMRQMAGMTGGTFFWVFFFLERENEREHRHMPLPPKRSTCWTGNKREKIQPCRSTDTHTDILFTHTHKNTLHMPSIISLFDALASGLIGILRVWQLNIRMMEMSLSRGGLWLTCELVANIQCLTCPLAGSVHAR